MSCSIYTPSQFIIKRCLDICLSISLLTLTIPLLAIIVVLIKLTSKGPILYWSKRMGRHNLVFNMPKFRTMVIYAPTTATNLLPNPASYITPFGRLLRTTSLDELPQLWNIIKGDMSFVGPRPVLTSEDKLIASRTQYNIEKLIPGLTGWAQINGRDELSIKKKLVFDKIYMNNYSLWLDLKILGITIKKMVFREGISH